ncbi:MAG TPA: cytochrome c biogenesis protein ResB [Streptosporangiaceae bacterium]|nr:cytochrome c biogenesis protein ResB [Streptosporangiaceae bacterium]
MTSTPVTTTPAAPPQQAAPRLGPGGWLRWAWRQLTSMRTALILLFLLAIASVPGSVLPQEGIDPAAVSQYYTAHPSLAPILNRLSLFSVFAAPWFAAIYLLLFLSLAGCVLPRTLRLVGQARQQPPRAPRRLTRLPMSASYQTALPPEQALSAAGSMLGGKRFRLRTGDGWVSAEKGYLREVGNLVFHIALLALLASVGIGGLFGYKANRLLIGGQSFADTPTALDVFRPGRLVSPSDLAPFSIGLQHFSASYVRSGPTVDEPITFNGALRYTTAPGQPARSYDLQVNHPLVVDGVSVYLIGHGYAPEFTVTDGTGKVVFSGPVPFIPVEQSGFTSEGVVKVPDAAPTQLGFAGVFLPAAQAQGGRLVSVFPAALRPEVSLIAYGGNLGENSGASQSVYSLDLSGMHRLSIQPRPLAIGQSMTLPNGAGKITYTGYRQWISLAITYDPGQLPALISGVLALAGLVLSFMVRRRRVFVRVVPGPGGGALVEVGGLARSDAAGGFETEFAELARDLRTAQDGSPLAAAPAAAARPDPADPAPAEPDGAGPAAAEPDGAGPAPAEADGAGPAPAGVTSAESDAAELDPEPVSAAPVGAGPASSDHDQSLGVRDGE